MLLLLLSNKIHPRVSHWPRSAVLWPLQLFSLTSGPQNLPPPPSKRLMFLPPGTWRSKILEVPPSSRFMPRSRCCPAECCCRQLLGAPERAQNPGCGRDPLAPLRAALAPRDTTGHKAGIDLQPSEYTGYLNATRNYGSPILCTEASLPPLRSQGKKDVWESQLEAQIYPNHYQDLHSSSHLF